MPGMTKRRQRAKTKKAMDVISPRKRREEGREGGKPKQKQKPLANAPLLFRSASRVALGVALNNRLNSIDVIHDRC